MQLYALDNKDLVLAQNAQKHKNYLCPECLNKVRVRSGPHRQIHFYHLSSNFFCNQHKKTLTHLQIQLSLHSQMPGSTIEKSFSQIHRIADVSWEEYGIVFEVQYSAISLAEIKARCSDYKKLGLSIVWILHDTRFNKRRMTNAEAFLRQNNAYYSNIDATGQVKIYDQFDICRNMIKIFKGPPLKVCLANPNPLQRLDLKIDLPQALQKRASNYIFYFKGDLIDRFLENTSNKNLQSMLKLESHFLKKTKTKNNFDSVFQFLKKSYITFLNILLEKCIREV